MMRPEAGHDIETALGVWYQVKNHHRKEKIEKTTRRL